MTRLVVLVPRRAVVAPVEERVDDDRVHRVAQAVVGVGRRRRPPRVAEVVGEQRLVAVDLPVDRLGVGVEQQLGRVAAVAAARGRRGRARGSRSAGRAARRAGSRARRSRRPRAGRRGSRRRRRREAQLDPLGDLGEEGEVDARAVVGRAEGVGLARPDLHGLLSSVIGRRAAALRGDSGRRGRRAHSPLPRPVGATAAVCRSPAPAGRRWRQPEAAQPGRPRLHAPDGVCDSAGGARGRARGTGGPRGRRPA